MLPEDLLAIEEEVLKAVVGTWAESVKAVHKLILILLAGVDGLDMAEVVPRVQEILETLEVPEHMNSEAMAGIIRAHIFGAELANQADDEEVPRVALSKSARKAVATLREDAEASLQLAKDNLSKPLIGGGAQAINTAIAPVIQNPAKAEAATAWAVNAASNSAVAKIARDTGRRLCWISERDSCAACQSYNGLFDEGGEFPLTQRFLAKPIKVYQNRLPHPPLHPRCRCAVEVGISDSYAEALRREAERSILRGVKLESESDKVRLDAAKRLLESGTNLPQSVQKYAARSVRRGEFI